MINMIKTSINSDANINKHKYIFANAFDKSNIFLCFINSLG